MITSAEYASAVLAILRQRGFSDEEIRTGLLEMEKGEANND